MEDGSDDNAHTMSNAAFDIAQWIILAGYIDDDINERIRFEFVEKAGIAAEIRPDRTGYKIAIGTGTYAAIVEVIHATSAANGLDDFISPESLEELGIKDEETAWDFVFVTAMVFIALHEAGHCLAGHLGLLTDGRQMRRRLSLSESENRILAWLRDAADAMSLAPIEVNKMMELETDGMAADLVYTDLFEIFRAFEDHVPLTDRASETCSRDLIRLATLGMMIVIGLIERRRLKKATNGPGIHPLPLARLLNITGRRLRHLQRNSLVERQDEAAITVHIDDPEEVVDIARDAFWLMLVVDRALGEPVFNVLPDSAAELSPSSFASDLQAYLSGQQPGQTEAGKELAEAASKAGPYLQYLQSYRLAAFWRGEAALQQTVPGDEQS